MLLLRARLPMVSPVGCLAEQSLSAKILRSYAEACDVEEVCFLCRERRPPSPPDWLALLTEICALPGGVPRAVAFEATLRAMPPPPPPPPEDDELAMMQYRSNPPPPPVRAPEYSCQRSLWAGLFPSGMIPTSGPCAHPAAARWRLPATAS